jgi:hypothetical protein
MRIKWILGNWQKTRFTLRRIRQGVATPCLRVSVRVISCRVLSVVLVIGLCVGCGGKVSAPTALPKETGTAKTSQVEDVAPAAQPLAPVEGDMGALLEKKCTVCHTLDRVKNFDHEETWQVTVTRMIEQRNAAVSPEDAKNIVAYLDKTYPKK